MTLQALFIGCVFSGCISTLSLVGMARCAVPVAQRSAGATASPAGFNACILVTPGSASTSLGGDIAARCPYLEGQSPAAPVSSLGTRSPMIQRYFRHWPWIGRSCSQCAPPYRPDNDFASLPVVAMVALATLSVRARGAHAPRVWFFAPSRKTRSRRNGSSVRANPARTPAGLHPRCLALPWWPSSRYDAVCLR